MDYFTGPTLAFLFAEASLLLSSFLLFLVGAGFSSSSSSSSSSSDSSSSYSGSKYPVKWTLHLPRKIVNYGLLKLKILPQNK